MFPKAKKVYFVGIGGIGISAVARMMLAEGREVHGSDFSASEITEELAKLGAHISIGQGMELIPKDTELIIYTVALEKYAAEFLNDIKKLSCPSFSYPEALHEISKGKVTIAVAGTHGKTTTTAMVAKVLIDAGLDPTVIVGSLLVDHHSNFIAGKGNYFVVEACEYKRSFLQLEPTIGIILNIDDDHLDYYGDLKGVQKGFAEFVEKIKPEGVLICNPAAQAVVPIVADANRTVIDYTAFVSKVPKLRFPGAHVRSDAAVALAVAKHLGVSEAAAKQSLADFRGTWRRFEFKGQIKNGAQIFDDYGHHPSEIAATISGVREMFPDKKLTVVFQPHLFSRTKEHLEDFAKSLAAADSIILTDIFAAREAFDPDVSSKDIVDRIKKIHPHVLYIPKFEDIVSELKKGSSGNDIIMTMGAGDIYKVGEMLRT